MGEGLVIRTEDPSCKCWVKDTEAQTLCTLKITNKSFLATISDYYCSSKGLLNVDDCNKWRNKIELHVTKNTERVSWGSLSGAGMQHCRWASSSYFKEWWCLNHQDRTLGFLGPEEGTVIIQNVGNHSPNDKVSYHISEDWKKNFCECPCNDTKFLLLQYT